MFPRHYWPARYFTPKYWPPVVSVITGAVTLVYHVKASINRSVLLDVAIEQSTKYKLKIKRIVTYYRTKV